MLGCAIASSLATSWLAKLDVRANQGPQRRLPPQMTDRQKASDKDITSVRLARRERVASVDPRAHAAWRTWLAALARDPDAVTAAALAYESLAREGREAWL